MLLILDKPVWVEKPRHYLHIHTSSNVLLCALSIYTNLQNHLNKFVMLNKVMEKKEDVIPPLKHA